LGYQVLEVRNVDGRLRIAPRGRKPGERDPPPIALGAQGSLRTESV